MNAPEKIYAQSFQQSGPDILIAGLNRKYLDSDIEYTRSNLMGWQPIETAPKDGSRILLWDDNLKIAVSGNWHVEPTMDNPSDGYTPVWAWWVSDWDILDMWEDSTPTHWMPLFEPPKESDR
jgi:hypothetical protein